MAFAGVFSGSIPRFLRVPIDLAAGTGELVSYPILKKMTPNCPVGDGHPVVVCPGFLTGDGAMRRLRHFLRDLGYESFGWSLGRNRGFGTTGFAVEALVKRVDKIVNEYNQKVSLVGWSLGGVMAREYARIRPDNVRQVIALGSPLSTVPLQSIVYDIYRVLSDEELNEMDVNAYVDQITTATPDVPCTSIFSKFDGVVPWECSVLPSQVLADNIEVYGSHLGLIANPSVFAAISDRLAQREEDWAPFDRKTGLYRALLYPTSGHGYGLSSPLTV